MSKQESPLDFESSIKRLNDFLRPYHEFSSGMSTVTKLVEKSNYLGTIEKLGESKFLRVLKCTENSVRILLTADKIEYPGEQYSAPKSINEGYKVLYEDIEGKPLIKTVIVCDVEKTKRKGCSEFYWKNEQPIRLNIPVNDLNPIATAFDHLPQLNRLKAFFDILH